MRQLLSFFRVRLFRQTLVLITVTRLALWVMPVARVRRSLRALIGADRDAMRRMNDSGPIVRAIAAASQYSPVGTTCLTNALVGEALLSRQGFSSQIRIGVMREQNGAFAAHAWLEQNGEVILGGRDSAIADYKPLPNVEQLFL